MKAVPIYSIYDMNKIRLFTFYTREFEENYSDSIKTFQELKIVRITEGNGKWFINNKDYSVKKGDIILLGPIDFRRFYHVEQNSMVKIEQIVFIPIALYPNLQCTELYFNRKKNFKHVIDNNDLNYDQIIYCFNQIRDESLNASLFKDERIAALLMDILILISRSCLNNKNTANKMTSNAANYKLICEAINYINNNYNENLSLDTLSRKFNISPSYFSRLFREFNGINVNKYITRCRIFNVIDKIKSQNIGIIEAAYESGFNSSSGFYRAFKEFTGTNPSKYIENLK